MHMCIFPEYFHSFQQILQEVCMRLIKNVSSLFKGIAQINDPRITNGTFFKNADSWALAWNWLSGRCRPGICIFEQVSCSRNPDLPGASTRLWCYSKSWTAVFL